MMTNICAILAGLYAVGIGFLVFLGVIRIAGWIFGGKK